MSVESKLPPDLLRDSEATLRIVDSLLGELHDSGADSALESTRVAALLGELTSRPAGLANLPHVLLRAFAEVSTALETLRRSRDVLERATVERVQRTQEKLREVSSATEVAATDMLNGLDYSIQIIDRLDNVAGDNVDDDGGEASRLRADLRDELFRLMGCLQFQDITEQQLQHAAALMAEVEGRLAEVAALFGAVQDTAADTAAGGSRTFDPFASMNGADTRQAVADSIFTAPEAKAS